MRTATKLITTAAVVTAAHIDGPSPAPDGASLESLLEDIMQSSAPDLLGPGAYANTVGGASATWVADGEPDTPVLTPGQGTPPMALGLPPLPTIPGHAHAVPIPTGLALAEIPLECYHTHSESNVSGHAHAETSSTGQAHAVPVPTDRVLAEIPVEGDHTHSELNVSGHAHAETSSTGHARGGTPCTDGGRGRHLRAVPSTDNVNADMISQQMRQKRIKAEDLRNLDGLTNLAKEHFGNFEQLIGGGRTLAPMFKIRIGSACSGSSSDLLSVIAIKRALAQTYPGVEFEYVFNCEQDSKTCAWIMALHKLMDQPALGRADGTQAALGLAETQTACNQSGKTPCCFDDLLELFKGSCVCCAHAHHGPRKLNKHKCDVPDFDLLICSTSCRDFSKYNQNKAKTTIFTLDSTPGGSAQTFKGL